MKISVVIPTYNEAGNISRLVSALFALPLDVNILIVDDNSPDGTGYLVDELAVDYPGRDCFTPPEEPRHLIRVCAGVPSRAQAGCGCHRPNGRGLFARPRRARCNGKVS